jgi:hypothetical protein
MADVKFEDNSMKVKAAIDEALLQFLEEAASELQSQAVRGTPVDTGQLEGSWAHTVDESNLEAKIGSPLENAIWTEFGTGEYALKGNGRKGGWFYKDDKGQGHFTHGKKPVRMLHNAFEQNKGKIIKRAEQIMKGLK